MSRNDNSRGNDGTHSGVHSREPARTITMLDYEGSPLKSDSNEAAVESLAPNREPQRLRIDLLGGARRRRMMRLPGNAAASAFAGAQPEESLA